MRWVIGPLLALQFLTVLPVPVPHRVSESDFGRSVAFFPLAGLILGCLLAMADWAAQQILPAPLPAAVTIALALALTGALHFDGLLDVCDALAAHRSADERLAIMRDSHVGGYAVAGGLAITLIRFAALLTLAGPARFEALILMATWGRLGIAYAVFAHPYGRPERRPGRLLKETMTGRRFAIALLVAGVPAAVLWGAAAGLLLIATWLTAEGLARVVRRHLPGLTGDVYGATCELVEVTVLIVAAILFGA